MSSFLETREAMRDGSVSALFFIEAEEARKLRSRVASPLRNSESLRNPVAFAESKSAYLTKIVVFCIVSSPESTSIASAKESIAFA